MKRTLFSVYNLEGWTFNWFKFWRIFKNKVLEDLPNEKTLKKFSLYIKRSKTVKLRIKMHEYVVDLHIPCLINWYNWNNWNDLIPLVDTIKLRLDFGNKWINYIRETFQLYQLKI